MDSAYRLFDADMGSNPEIIFLNMYFFLTRESRREMVAREGDVEVEVNDGCIKQTDRASYYIWQYLTVSNSSEANQAVTKVVQRLQPANFATKSSVVAVLPEQRPTFWDVLY